MRDSNPFDALARDYEAWHAAPKGRACLAREEEALAALLPPGGSERPFLLEVGCGTAFWFPFWRRWGYRPAGLDPSGPMLEAARAKGETLLVRGRGEDPPFRERSFSVLAFLTALEFTEEPSRVLARAAPLLVPGGTLLAGVLAADSSMAQRRKASGRPPWDRARFFTARDLEVLLAPFGSPRILPARPLSGEDRPFFLAGSVTLSAG